MSMFTYMNTLLQSGNEKCLKSLLKTINNV